MEFDNGSAVGAAAERLMESPSTRIKGNAMRTRLGKWLFAVGFVTSVTSSCLQAANLFRLEEGSPALQSAGPLAFGPQGVLFVGDTKGATVYAIGTGDVEGDPNAVQVNLENLDAALATALNAAPGQVKVNDLAVNPLSGSVYLSVAVGAEAKPGIVRVSAEGKVSPVSLEQVLFAKSVLPNPPEDKVTGNGGRQRNLRDESITDLAFVDGNVLVSGMSSNASPSAVRTIPFPFSDDQKTASLEIYHAAHGRSEDNAAIRTFVPFVIDGQPNVLAGFTCTPLVRFPVSELQSDGSVKGTTVAELGNRNRPLDMIAYEQEGQNYLLMSNSARGVMKIDTRDIEKNEGLSEPVQGGGTAGQKYETISDLQDVVQMDRLGKTNLVVLTQKEGGPMHLVTRSLP